MRKILFISVLIMAVVEVPSYSSFIQQLRHQYKVDSELRPSDTLCYIIEIPNLCKSRKYDKLSFSQKRKRLFDILAKSKMFLCYTDAIDTVRTTFYSNPDGNLDYWYNTKHVIRMVPVDTNLCHPKFVKKMRVLADYIREYQPELIFIIDEINGIDEDLFWSLRKNRLFAVLYQEQLGVTKEEDAISFIINAPDYYFSSSLRLRIMLEADKVQ